MSNRQTIKVIDIKDVHTEFGGDLFLKGADGINYFYDYAYNYKTGLMFKRPTKENPLYITAEVREDKETLGGRKILFNPRILKNPPKDQKVREKLGYYEDKCRKLRRLAATKLSLTSDEIFEILDEQEE